MPINTCISSKINLLSVDQEGTCKGDICRLDKQFAEELNEIYEWSTDLEADSGFDRQQACVSSSGKPQLLFFHEVVVRFL